MAKIRKRETREAKIPETQEGLMILWDKITAQREDLIVHPSEEGNRNYWNSLIQARNLEDRLKIVPKPHIDTTEILDLSWWRRR
jgi:hypothetical protein